MIPITDFSIPRDSYGRPTLYPPEGGKRVGYSRCSTLAKDLDKPGDGLIKWHQTNAMVGIATTPTLMNRVKGLLARGAKWDTASGDFKDIVKTAEIIGGATVKADRGTSIHDFTGAVEDDTLDWSLVDEGMKPILDGYHEFIVSPGVFTFLARESFVAVNETMQLPGGKEVKLRAAGSVDRIGALDGKRRIIDVKTGKDDIYRMGVCGQLYLYQAGQLYRDDVVYQEADWLDWEPNEDWTASYGSHGCEDDYALMFHCPQTPDARGKWRWAVYEIPLDKGREIILGGQWARKLRSVPKFKAVDF